MYINAIVIITLIVIQTINEIIFSFVKQQMIIITITGRVFLTTTTNCASKLLLLHAIQYSKSSV